MSSRELLYERINLRVDDMMSKGLLDEAERIIKSSWYRDATASQAIGYKEFEPYFSGESTLDECIETLKRRSRNYAKRQLTWFRHNQEATFYNVDTIGDVSGQIIDSFYKGEDK